jgi:hypothetical protein
MFKVIFDRNGAKVYVKNLREKSAKRGFMKSFSHSSTPIVCCVEDNLFHSLLVLKRACKDASFQPFVVFSSRESVTRLFPSGFVGFLFVIGGSS